MFVRACMSACTCLILRLFLFATSQILFEINTSKSGCIQARGEMKACMSKHSCSLFLLHAHKRVDTSSID